MKKYQFLLLLLMPCVVEAQAVKCWQEPLILPTYEIEAPEKNPMFFTHDSYQGASRVIYPYKREDNLTDRKVDREYQALYLENEYMKVCVLPEIGGRLFYATDKTNDYEIFYRQHVIKPANIGMLGAWISGGIEFCVFHHHRASTNIPVNYRLVENPDGSATIWLGETEPRHRMKWSLGISLYPGKSYLEVDGRLINPTENSNSILYWANVATHVNADYQTIFPPSTDHAVFHAKNSFVDWPITSNTFRGFDYYQEGIDASWWKNHPNPISMFVHDLKEGFLAGYDHGKQAGTMHIANPHIVKGAKLWQWGPGAHGSMWDSQVLTDSDGPYAELMTGAYSDNQPDYSWLNPYETKVFKQYWYPLRETGGAVAANLDATLNLQKQSDGSHLLALNTTASHDDLMIRVFDANAVYWQKTVTIDPANPFTETISLNADGLLHVDVTTRSGRTLIEYQTSEEDTKPDLPETVTPPREPKEIESLEELYFTGLRLKQFHHAKLDPTAYFLEALQRDPLDSRSNLMMGIMRKEAFDLEEAKRYFRKSLARSTANYTRPRDAEALYHLGCILQTQGQLEAAYDTLYRAAWDQAQASAAYYHLAQISNTRKKREAALTEIERSLHYNAANINARNLQTSILRTLGQTDEALAMTEQVLALDPLNARTWREKLLLEKSELAMLKDLLGSDPESYLELAIAYYHDGFLADAIDILDDLTNSTNPALSAYPTVHYYLAHLHRLDENLKSSAHHLELARALPIDYCFPYRQESIAAFLGALSSDPADANAHYYLGNLLYDKQPQVAMEHWRAAVHLNPNHVTAHRNLGWGYQQTNQDLERAISSYEKAIALDRNDATLFFELDKLYERNGTPVETRLQLLTSNHETVYERPDATLQEVKVLLLAGKYETAVSYLRGRFFPRQEGVEDLHDIYVDACLLGVVNEMKKGDEARARHYLDLADEYPENHQIAADPDEDRNIQIKWYRSRLQKTGGKELLEDIVKYKTEDPMLIYYQAMAHQELGNSDEVQRSINDLRTAGEDLLVEEKIDFFSIFGEQQSPKIRNAQGHYYHALMHLLLKNNQEAKVLLEKSQELNPADLWAGTHLQRL